MAAVCLLVLPGALPALAAAPPAGTDAASGTRTPAPSPPDSPGATPAAATSPTRTDGGLALDLTDVTPAVAVPGEPVTVLVTVTNTSAEAVPGVDVRAALQASTPISRTALHSWPSTAHLARVAEVGVASYDAEIAPGRAAMVTLHIPAELVPQVGDATWGPRGLALTATSTAAGAAAPAAPAAPAPSDAAPTGSLRTWLLLDAPESVVPTPFSVVVPVTAGADRLDAAVGLGEPGALIGPAADAPATSATAAAADLMPAAADLLAALDVPGATAAVDPALLRPAQDPAGVPVLDAQGRPTSDALDAARALAVPDRELVLLPAGDPDVAALAHASRDQPLAQAVAEAADAAAALDLPARTDIALPVGSIVDLATLAAARRAGSAAAVLPGSAAPTARTVGWTPAARVDVPLGAGAATDAQPGTGAGTMPAVVGDPVLAQVVSGLLPAGPTETPTGSLGPVESRQLALAETAVIQRERPNHERPLTIYLERGQVPDADHLAVVLDALAEARWLRPQSLTAALAAEPQDPPRAALPDKEVARAEITAADIDIIARRLLDVRDVAAADPDPLVGPAASSARLLLAAAWRADPARRAEAVDRLAAELGEVPRLVAVAPSSTINLLATTSELPIRVTNGLPVAVDAVVTLDPPDARLTAPHSVQVTVPAHGEAVARVPVEAAGSGNLEVRVELATPGGTRLGATETFQIRVRADWETRGTAVAGIALAFLVVAGIVRTARRRRRRADS